METLKKKLIVGLTTGMIVGALGISTAWADPRGFQDHQGQRIYQGIRSGELTRAESRLLIKERYHQYQTRNRAWADGRLTPQERMRLHQMHTRVSRHIYMLKHNQRFRK
jgi:hypothetical protein